MTITISQIQDAAQAVGVPLNEAQAAQLLRYRDLLIEWNARFNLTAITDDAAILTHHFADSLTALRAFKPAAGQTLLDLGTGAGMPGIPLKIAQPGLDVTLMDSTGKKVTFCQAVIDDLLLPGISAVKERAEEAAHKPAYREQFDIVVARALAPMPVLVEYLLPFVRVGGCCVAMKGGDAASETEQAARGIQTLGGALARIEQVTLPGLTDQRALVIIEKQAPSPSQYPRQAGKPRTSPL
ncbi:MAG TPA: 16S rRNA (guanine(527)-N(7))-methyltransferase RsmG [Anaerolineae bacterium]